VKSKILTGWPLKIQNPLCLAASRFGGVTACRQPEAFSF
jgi:hypothetical protein